MAALRSVLRIRPFRRLWLVLSVASFGDWLGLLATALFASQQVEGSVAQGGAFSGTIAIRLVPALILIPVGLAMLSFEFAWAARAARGSLHGAAAVEEDVAHGRARHSSRMPAPRSF